jgi:gliding motility-associated-like protein
MSNRFYTVLASLLFLSFLPNSDAQCDITVDAGPDIYVCAVPSQTQLDGSISGDYLSFMWTPLTGLSGANTLQPSVNVTQSTYYVLSASTADLSNNLVSNGDFESGNSGFTSDYIYNPGDLVPEGVYDVLSNPQDDHPNFAPCIDHTSGSGNMMVVNGAGTPNQDVWCETVAVTPNSQFVLSAWVTTVVASSPAFLQFSINGVTVGPIFNAPGTLCNWQNYFQIWNSGANTSATICIVNQNTALGGNDFALDDIVFAPVCVERDTVRIQVVNIAAVAAPASVILPCDGANTTLSGVGSSTGANITYLWETSGGNIVSGETTLNPVVNAAGSYTLTVSYVAPDGTLCEKMATVNVILNPNQLAAWITPPAPLGCGSATTTLFGNSTQSGFSTYAWETMDGNIVSGDNLKNCIVSQIGTYSLTVTNTITGCTATAEVSVIATTTPPIANAAVSDTLTCFQDTVALSATGSSSGSNISYAWTTLNGHFISGQNTALALADSIGIYVLNVTNTTNNCTSRDTITVVGNLVVPYMFLPPQQQITCTSDTITMIVYLYPPPFVLINWTASNGGNIVSGQFTPNPQVNAQGNYNVTIQDPINGCIANGGVFVTNNIAFPTVNISPPGGITCQSPSVTLSANGSSSGPNFGYQWSASNGGNIVSGDNSLNPVVNAAGNYSLVILDSLNGCTSNASTSVLADTNVVTVIANAPDTLSCNIQSILLNANGSSSGVGISYAWTTTNGNILLGADTPTPTVNQSGTYQLLLTNTANGCAGTDLAVVIENVAAPQTSITPPALLTCANPTQILTAQNNSPAGSFTYQWTAANGGNITLGQNTLTPTVDAPGTYTLTTTNLINGCTATVSTTVDLAVGVPTAVAAANGAITCVQATQTLGSNGSSSGAEFSYTWGASNGGSIVGSNTLPTITVNAPGTYTLTVSNATNGCTASNSTFVILDTVPPAAIILTPAPTLTCTLTEVLLQGDGTGLAVVTTPDGNISSSPNPFTALVDQPGTYILTTTDPGNGCTAVDSVEVFQNIQVPSLSVAAPATLTCVLLNQNIQAQNLSLPGNFSYSWTASNGGNIVSGNNGLSPSIDTQGTYILTTTNLANGCTASISASVVEDIAAPNLQITGPGPITCANPSQTIQGQNLSLPGNFTYNWTASNGGNIFSGNATLTPVVDLGGIYTLVTTNVGNGCSSTATVTVGQNNTPPTANAGMDATLTCNLNSLTINGSGAGAANLNYSWAATNGGNIASGGSSPTPVIDAPGTYTLTVTNPLSGCFVTDVVEILNDASAPTVNAGTAPQLTCILTQTPLSASASMGANYSYNWTASSGGNIMSGPTTLTPTVNEPGVYTLVVTNTSNGCTRSSSITVLENIIPPVVNAGANATLTCALTSLSLTGSSTGGSATFAWQTTGGAIVSGGTTLSPTVSQTGAYTLSATLLSNGCSASSTVNVGIDTIAPIFNIQQPGLLTCTQLTSALTGVVQQPGAGNFSATWSSSNGHFVSGQNALNAIVDAPGTYILTIENTQNGCDVAIAIPVFQSIMPPTALAANVGEITCAVQSVGLNGSGSSSGNGFSYLWTASAGAQILSGGTTLMPTVGSAGTYTLLVTNTGTGCTASTTTMVSSNTTPPTIAIAQPALLTCVANMVTLNGGGSSNGPNFSNAWGTSAGNILSGQNSLMPVVNAPGTYILSIQNSQNGCSASSQVLVNQNIATPGADAGNAGELHCNNLQITLNGTSPTIGNMAYAWTSSNGNIVGGATAPASTVDAPGQYVLTVTNPINGCMSTDNVSVTAVPPPTFDPALEQPDCHDQNGVVNFGNVSGGKAPFQYSTDGGQSFENQAIATNLPPNTYALVVQDAFGCTASETVMVEEPFVPTLSIATVAILEVGDSISLTPFTDISPANVASWEWSPVEGLSCADCENPWARPFRSTNYSLIVTDVNGCEAEAQVQVRVNRKRNIYAPNVFSPNDDGKNDHFMIFGKGVKEIQTLQVFDRWGEALFIGEHLQANDEQSGWDGTHRGDPMTPAVFVWWARVEFVDGTLEVFYGDVTLVR